MECLAIIPARGGSKSIPKKNIVDFCGKPLIAYSINQALQSQSINRVIVSTDSQEIADIARSYGAEVPFFRPAEYARDDTTDLPVFVHCLKWLESEEGYIPDIVAHLRVTSPLRTVEMLEKGIKLLINNPEADAVRAVCEPSQSPFKMWTIGKDGFLVPLVKTDIEEQYNQPRQILPEVYWQNGYIDITRRNTIINLSSMTGRKIIPLIVQDHDIVDIDNEITLRFAEEMYKSLDN